MQRKSTGVLCSAALAASAVLMTGAPSASGAVLGLWDFREFTTNYDPAPGPYSNYAVSAAGSVTSLSNVGAASLQADTTRDTTAAPLGSFTLLIAAGGLASTSGSNVPPPPVSTTDYLGFTLTAFQDNLELTEFSFDLGTSIGANTNTTTSGGVEFTTLETNVQLFASTDGGTTFNAIGPVLESIADNANNTGAFTGMNPFSVDLSSLAALDTSESIEFRMAFTDNRGGNTGTMGHYLDNVSIEGNVIPEPGSLALAGIAGLGLLARRRRQA